MTDHEIIEKAIEDGLSGYSDTKGMTASEGTLYSKYWLNIYEFRRSESNQQSYADWFWK